MFLSVGDLLHKQITLNKCGLLDDTCSGMSSIKVALCCKLLASLVPHMGSEETEIAGPRPANALVTYWCYG